MTEDKDLLEDIKFAPAGFKVSPGWRVGHLREEQSQSQGF